LILGNFFLKFATRFQILRQNCSKFDLGFSSTLNPDWELAALRKPIAGFQGPSSKGQGSGWDERREVKLRRARLVQGLLLTTFGGSNIPVFIQAHSAWPSLRG